MACVAAALSSTSLAFAGTLGSASGSPLRAEVLNMGEDAARITDGYDDRYFKQG